MKPLTFKGILLLPFLFVLLLTIQLYILFYSCPGLIVYGAPAEMLSLYHVPGSLSDYTWVFNYIFLVISIWAIIQTKDDGKWKKYCTIFTILTLLFNAFWSVVFFYFLSVSLGFIDLILLDCAILAAMYSYYKINRFAAYFLGIYAIRVFYATYLNYKLLAL